MTPATMAGIIIAACGALILGMAALIKLLILGKLNEIQGMVSGLSRDMHRMDIRLTTLEAEHRIGRCPAYVPHVAPELDEVA